MMLQVKYYLYIHFTHNMKRVAIILAILVTSCRFSHSNIDHSVSQRFSREDFVIEKQLVDPEEIIIENLLNPVCYNVIKDSLIVVVNQSNCKYFLEIYSLNNRELIASYITKGNGPGEMVDCDCFFPNSTSSLFYVRDMYKNILYITNLDSLLYFKSFAYTRKFKFSDDLYMNSEICIINDSQYIGYNMWYLDDSTYNNKVSPISVYSIDSLNTNSNKINSASYLVAPVTGAHLLLNPKSGNVWMADIHRDKISIFNDSLHLIKTLIGPDFIESKYSAIQGNAPWPIINFSDGNEPRAYSGYTITDENIYFIYEGTKQYDREHLTPVEVFKIGLDGSLKCNYKLDRNIFNISVDKNETYLYGTSKNQDTGERILVKYKL